jgi:hypothetical protein
LLSAASLAVFAKQIAAGYINIPCGYQPRAPQVTRSNALHALPAGSTEVASQTFKAYKSNAAP